MPSLVNRQSLQTMTTMQKEVQTARQRKESQRWYRIHRNQGKTTPGIMCPHGQRKKLESTGTAQELEREHTKMNSTNSQQFGERHAYFDLIG